MDPSVHEYFDHMQVIRIRRGKDNVVLVEIQVISLPFRVAMSLVLDEWHRGLKKKGVIIAGGMQQKAELSPSRRKTGSQMSCVWIREKRIPRT